MALDATRVLIASLIGGVLLVLIGLGAYILTDFASVTALIPSLFGMMIAILALVGRRPGRQNLSVIGIGLVSFFLVLGSLMGIPDVIDLIAGDDVERPIAAVSQALTVVVGLGIIAVTGTYAWQHS